MDGQDYDTLKLLVKEKLYLCKVMNEMNKNNAHPYRILHTIKRVVYFTLG